MSSDPVSWLVIEEGWRVTSSDGEDVGSVHEVIGDSGKDIFNGLAVSPGVLKATRYVPSERVGAIREGIVELLLTAQDFERLDDYAEPPPSEEIRADTTDI